MKENLRTILRCTGLAAIVIAALVLVPTAAEAGVCTPGNHGVSIFKSCVSPKNSCTSDLDCSDGVFCNGVEQCATETSAGSNVVDCSITLSNPTAHCDDITVTEACDAIQGATGAPSSSCDILVTSAPGGTGPGCDALSNLGGAETCTLNPGESIVFQANYYTIQPADPDPLGDQATITIVDTCSSGGAGCGTTPSNVQFTASTDLVSGCSPGTQVDCPTDNDACNGPEFCDETLGACNSGPPVVCPDDGLFCNGPEVCDPTDGSCDSGPAVDCPSDNDACNGPEFCDEDADACASGPAVTCDDPNCQVCDPATGLCDPIDPLPEICQPGDEICRTPGFWGTHGGTEKANSVNITLAVLNAYNAANDPDLTICGQVINNTTLGSTSSALEAICASPKGDSRIQLARQLTAAALNCILSSAVGTDAASCGASLADGDVCSGVSIGAVFDACNAACAAGDVTAEVDLDDDPTTDPVEVSCIGAIDCFNNGGVINETTGECESAIGETCHDRDLETDCFDFQPPGPAGSPRECNDSRKNDVIVVPPAP